MSAVRTLYCSAVIVFLTARVAFSPVQTQFDEEAQPMTHGCHDALKNAGQPPSFDAGMCLGIIKGLHYLSQDVCIPPGTTLGEIADIVSGHVDNHKGRAQDDFRETSLDAMRAAWPCGKRRDI
jgi:Rap1a immunity proteins